MKRARLILAAVIISALVISLFEPYAVQAAAAPGHHRDQKGGVLVCLLREHFQLAGVTPEHLHADQATTPQCTGLAMVACGTSQASAEAYYDTALGAAPAGFVLAYPVLSLPGFRLLADDEPSSVALSPPKEPPRI